MARPVPRRRISVTYDTTREDRFVVNDPKSDAERQLHVRLQCRMSVNPRRNRGTVVVANLAEGTRNSLSGVIESTLDFISDPNGDLGQGPNVGTFGIGGLANATLTKEVTIQLAGGYCEIDAGLDRDIGRVFEGSVSRIRNVHAKPRWETTFEIGDGVTSSMAAIANQRFADGARMFDVVKHIVRSMALGVGNLTFDQFQAAVGANIVSLLPRGYTAVGKSDDILTSLLRYSGAEWFVDSGDFFIVRKGEPVNPDAEPIVLEQGVAGGLRAEPSIIDGNGISVETTYRPELRIGHLVETRSKQFVGRWRAEVVDHELDNRDGSWTTKALLRTLPGILGGVLDG